jgi:acyl-CoA synthetase (AMP-forming)/AMP-acid ligase II
LGTAIPTRSSRIATAGQCRDVARTAAQLPRGGHMLNACADRYVFAVGLAAGIVTRTVSLLPANLAPETIRQLLSFRPDLVCLTDGDVLPEVPGIRYVEAAPGDAEADFHSVPEIDGDQPVAWLFTSGSTGAPVPHLRTWASLCRNVGIEARRLGLDGAASGTIVATVPAQHSYGFESSLLVALRSGAAFSSARPFRVSLCRPRFTCTCWPSRRRRCRRWRCCCRRRRRFRWSSRSGSRH